MTAAVCPPWFDAMVSCRYIMVGLLQYLFPALVVAVAAQSTLAQSGPLAFPAGLKHNTQQKGENIHMLSQRHLQQAGAPAEAAEPAMVTSVSTAEELQTAVRTGRSYIEIVEHLTLDSLTLINSSDINLGPKLLGTIPSTVKSIRVRCTSSHACLICVFGCACFCSLLCYVPASLRVLVCVSLLPPIPSLRAC